MSESKEIPFGPGTCILSPEPFCKPTYPDIENRFTYHPPKNESQQERYVKLRNEAKELALSIFGACPDSRERSVALTKLEEVIMWANASIARHE